jgi:hypothetical protein
MPPPEPLPPLAHTTGGRIGTGTGPLTLNGAVTATTAADGGAATIEGNPSLGRATWTFTVKDGAAVIDLNVGAAVSGATGVGLTKNRTGHPKRNGGGARQDESGFKHSTAFVQGVESQVFGPGLSLL